MGASMPPKDPDAILDYGCKWLEWLDGDTISSSTWIVPSGLTEDSASHTTTTTTIWLSGGTAGQTYEVVNRITTAAGRKNDQTLEIPMLER